MTGGGPNLLTKPVLKLGVVSTIFRYLDYHVDMLGAEFRPKLERSESRLVNSLRLGRRHPVGR